MKPKIHQIFLKQVTEMAKIDQDLRFSAMRARTRQKKPGLTLKNYMIYVTDWVHSQRLKGLIKKFGYPDMRSFGKEGMASFWLLIQHQDYDTELQKDCLKNCSFSKTQFEHLMDRILLNEGKPQRYGTQFKGKIRQ